MLMKKTIHVLMTFWAITLFSFNAKAAFVMDGTRYIYNEGNEEISLVVSNALDEEWGGQLWLESNVKTKNVQDSFVAFPSLFVVRGNNSQIIRIARMDTSLLPNDRESLFWLNLQELPPISNGENNALGIAIRTKVKLLYRPKSISDGRLKAEEGMFIKRANSKLYLVNPTPYFFAIIDIMEENKTVSISEDVRKELGIFKPFSEISLPDFINVNEKIEVKAINDFGAVNKFKVESREE